MNAFLTLLTKVAPTVLAAVSGPMAGAIVTMVSSAIGVPAKNIDELSQVVSDSKLTSEQLSEIRKLEMQLQEQERELGFKYAELAFKEQQSRLEDVASARARESTVRDKVNSRIAYFVLAAFVALVATMILFPDRAPQTAVAGTLIGYLSAKADQITAYYFGSSKSHEATTKMLADSVPAQANQG